MHRKIILPLLLIILLQTVFSQTTEIKTDSEKQDDFKKQTIEFLGETGREVKNLRSLENRISFSAEVAGLMWFHDEKEARSMYQVTISDFRQLLLDFNTQFNSLSAAEETEDTSDDFLFGEMNSTMLMRKFEKIMSVRYQIALSIAEHDGQMGYDFFTSTAQMITNQKLLQQLSYRDSYLELRLIDKIAENDIDKTIEIARKMLASGKTVELLGILQKIYAKDDKKGAALGEEIISKIKSSPTVIGNYYSLSSVLTMGANNLEAIKDTPNKKPLFSREALRDIADLMAQEILKRNENEYMDVEGFASLIEKFSPARAQQIRLKFKKKEKAETDVPAISVQSDVSNNRQEIAAAQQKQQQELFDDVKKLADKQLPKEEREKIIAKAREIIAKVKNREQKVMALSLLASQVAALGDKELANEIMLEARNLAPFQPKNYKDYLTVWMLVSGYASADTDKAFPILEDTVSRLNETITAFIKVAEFIDVRNEFIEDDEVQVGSFGGELTRGLLSELGAANTTLLQLSKADFQRTRNVANRFDRLEVRILAKMLILRAVLGEKKTETNEEVKETVSVK